MHSKLQEITDKLYNEGISKAQKEAEDIIINSREIADKEIRNARKSAEEIIKKANDAAETLRKNVLVELKLSLQQAKEALIQELSESITLEVKKDLTEKLFIDKEFLSQFLIAVITKKGLSISSQIEVSIPEEESQEFIEHYREEILKNLNKEISITPTKELESGFRIKVVDRNYVIQFTKDEFDDFFLKWLKPISKQILFK